MSIHRISSFASKATAVLVLLSITLLLDAAAAESAAQPSASPTVSTNVAASSGAQGKLAPGACRVIDRPKHKVVHCDCAGDALAGVASVDAAAILRLFLGNPSCRAPATARE